MCIRDRFEAPLHPYSRGLLRSRLVLQTDRSRPIRTLPGLSLIHIYSKAIVAGVFPGRATVPTQATPLGLLPAGFGNQGIKYDTAPLTSVVTKLPSGEKAITVGYDSGAPDDLSLIHI